MFLSEGKHLLMFNVQLCLTFERVSVTLKFSLVMDTTPMALSLVQWAVALLVLVQYYQYCLAVYSLLNVQNNSKSNTNRPHSKSQTFENQLKINEHISLIILNSLCHRLINLGDFTWFIQVDSIKKTSLKNYSKILSVILLPSFF